MEKGKETTNKIIKIKNSIYGIKDDVTKDVFQFLRDVIKSDYLANIFKQAIDEFNNINYIGEEGKIDENNQFTIHSTACIFRIILERLWCINNNNITTTENNKSKNLLSKIRKDLAELVLTSVLTKEQITSPDDNKFNPNTLLKTFPQIKDLPSLEELPNSWKENKQFRYHITSLIKYNIERILNNCNEKKSVEKIICDKDLPKIISTGRLFKHIEYDIKLEINKIEDNNSRKDTKKNTLLFPTSTKYCNSLERIQ